MQPHMFLGKAIALIVLLLVGYQFYRGFRHSLKSFERQGENLARVSDEFVRALFGCMGHLAKSDGRVSEDEIRAARLMTLAIACPSRTGSPGPAWNQSRPPESARNHFVSSAIAR